MVCSAIKSVLVYISYNREHERDGVCHLYSFGHQKPDPVSMYLPIVYMLHVPLL
jgi:hypothetical protein